ILEYRRSEKVLREKIQLLHRLYAFFRRIRNDGASLYRSFLFAYVLGAHLGHTRQHRGRSYRTKSYTMSVDK
ncbi:unnamed protein product, partial [Musa banksii]